MAFGSDVYRTFLTTPAIVLGLLGLVLLAVMWLIRRTSWEPLHTLPAQQHRSAGQIIADSWEMYRRNWWLMFKIGSPAAAVALVSAFALPVVAQTSLGPVIALLSGAVLLGANSIAHSGTAYALSAFDAGETRRVCDVPAPRPRPRGGDSGDPRRLQPVLLVLGLSFWLIPVAVAVGVGGGLWNSIIQLEGLAFLAAFRRSWQLVRGQFWTVAALIALAVLVGSLRRWIPRRFVVRGLAGAGRAAEPAAGFDLDRAPAVHRADAHLRLLQRSAHESQRNCPTQRPAKTSTPGPRKKAKAAFRPDIAASSRSVGPSTVGPVPVDQSLSVAVSVSPSIRSRQPMTG